MKSRTSLAHRPHTLAHGWHPLTHRLKPLGRRLAQRWGYLYLSRMGVLPPLQAFVDARDPGAYVPDYADLAYLYRTVLRQRPRTVLEFGSGCSTLVLALALHRADGGGTCLSLESDPAWAVQTAQALPVFIYGWCHLLLSPLAPAQYGALTGHAWAARPPTLVPDLIYLDGPGMTPAHAALNGLCALDLLYLEPLLRVGCRLIVDGRPGQTAFLRQHFQRPWRFRRHHTMDRHVFTLRGEEG